jgi:hypothetical protein
MTTLTGDKLKAVEEYEALLTQLVQPIFNSQELWDVAHEEKKRYGNIPLDIEKSVMSYKKQLENRIIHRYRDGGYDHVSADDINLEIRLWKFAHHNAELWAVMTEDISWGNSDVTSYLGFSLMDSFIHNGIYDDWEMEIVEKENMYYFRSESDASWKNGKRIYPCLNKENMITVLDKLESDINTNDNKKTSEKKLKI